MFVKTTNGQVDKFPYTIGDLRKDNSNTSFPKNIPDETLSQFGVFPVIEQDAPSYDPITQRVDTAVQPSLVDNKWTLTKTVVNKTQEQIDADNANKAAKIRKQRDELLTECDWVAVKAFETNGNVPAEWQIYRQALRDVTGQDTFPVSVNWPTKPE